jgi:hypothetical protein
MDHLKLLKEVKKPTRKLIDMLASEYCVVGDNRGTNTSSYTFISTFFRNGANSKSIFKEVLYTLADQKAEILDDYMYILAIQRMTDFKEFWIKDFKNWKKKSHSRDRQYLEIVKFLFCKYEVPFFMTRVWMRYDSKAKPETLKWFIDIAQGKNIRNSENLPIPLTKKMAHVFLQAPDDFSPFEAFRYAQINNMGGNMRTVKGVLATSIGNNFNNNVFWTSVIKFFIDNPMLDTEQYGTIIDCIRNIKYENRRILRNERFVDVGPEHPGFVMKDRTANALLTAVDKWHKQMNKLSSGVTTKWEPFRYNNFSYTVGKDDNKRTYYIKQLLTAAELHTEGRHMGHCVASYKTSCSAGRTSIWSLNFDSVTACNTRLVTIEVNREGNIAQIRGKGNRLPDRYEMGIIEQWATKENLHVSKWLKI